MAQLERGVVHAVNKALESTQVMNTRLENLCRELQKQYGIVSVSRVSSCDGRGLAWREVREEASRGRACLRFVLCFCVCSWDFTGGEHSHSLRGDSLQVRRQRCCGAARTTALMVCVLLAHTCDGPPQARAVHQVPVQH